MPQSGRTYFFGQTFYKTTCFLVARLSGYNVRAVSEFYKHTAKILGKCPVSDCYLELCTHTGTVHITFEGPVCQQTHTIQSKTLFDMESLSLFITAHVRAGGYVIGAGVHIIQVC